MNLQRSMILLPLSATLALGQSTSHSGRQATQDQPESLAKRLYQQVLAHPSVGIPYGENLKIYAPYLSKALRQKMDTAVACSRDFYRRYPVDPNRPEKPPFAWLELGTFTGGDDEDEFHTFQIVGAEPAKDGSVEVQLRLTWGIPPEKPWFSGVALVIRQENRRNVVDDVIYMKVREGDTDWHLTQALSSGCNGGHWVGNPDAK